MQKQEISSKNAPKTIGPYSQAIKCGHFVFCSGQIPVDPNTSSLAGSDIEAQTRQVFKNLKAVLEAAGSSLNSVVKTTVYLKSLEDYKRMNQIYGEYFQKPYPARATVEVSRLPKDVLVEIECIAYVNC